MKNRKIYRLTPTFDTTNNKKQWGIYVRYIDDILDRINVKLFGPNGGYYQFWFGFFDTSEEAIVYIKKRRAELKKAFDEVSKVKPIYLDMEDEF